MDDSNDQNANLAGVARLHSALQQLLFSTSQLAKLAAHIRDTIGYYGQPTDDHYGIAESDATTSADDAWTTTGEDAMASADDAGDTPWPQLLRRAREDLGAFWSAHVECKAALSDCPASVINDPAKPLLDQRTTAIRRLLREIVAPIQWTTPDNPEHTPSVREFLRRAGGEFGGQWFEALEGLVRADDELRLLLDELADRKDRTADRQRRQKRRGRPKRDFETIDREAAVALKWKTFRTGGGCKADFVKTLEPRVCLSDFDRLLDRVAYDKKAAARTD